MRGHELIAQERERQIKEEGFNKEHDAEHSVEVLVAAAISYAMYDQPGCEDAAEENWPWDDCWWKPKEHRKNLKSVSVHLFLTHICPNKDSSSMCSTNI